MEWWVAEAWNQSPVVLGSHVFWVIFSICLHELGHGWAAIRQGDDTPIHTGHMTWNPMVHMGPWSLICFALIGFTWGAMPVNPSRFRSRYGEAIVAFAGPLMNLGLIVAAAFILVVWQRFGPTMVAEHVFDNVETFLWMGASLNGVLFLFNLIPVPPLDGSRILADFWPSYNNLWATEAARVTGFIAIMLGMRFVGDYFAMGGDLLALASITVFRLIPGL